MKKALYGMPNHLNLVEGIQFGKTPLDYIAINTPPICNYRCDKCFTWASLNPLKEYIGTPKLLDVITEAKELGVKVVGLLGEGEPMLFQDFKQIIKHINDLGMITILATNGSVMDEEMTDFCYEHNVSPAISLDTLDGELYKSLYKGSADLDVTLKNINYARKVYAQSNFVKNNVKVHRLAVHMTVSASNYQNIEEIVDFCGDDIYFSCEHVARVGVANENAEIYGGKEDFTIYNQIKNSSHSVMRPMVIAESHHNPLACCFFYYGIAIGYEGEVMLDTHAVETKKKIGNVKDFNNLNEVVNRSKQLRNLFYDKFGQNYCIIRDDNYQKFIQYLEENKDPFNDKILQEFTR